MSESSPNALEGAYEDYLERFDAAFGPLAVGAFGKHNGQLVQKLTRDEYRDKRAEYEQLYVTFERAMLQGDTVNDEVFRMLRECAARLMQKAPTEDF